MSFMFDLKPIVATSGLLFLALSLVVWQVLNQRHHTQPVLLWTLGMALSGGGFFLLGLRDVAPAWATHVLANAGIFSGVLWRAMAVRAHLGQPVQALRHGLVMAVHMGLFSALFLSGHVAARVLFALLAWCTVTAYLAWWARVAFRTTRSRAALVLARAEVMALVASLLYLASRLVSQEEIVALPQTWPALGMPVVLALCALYGNLAYVGMVLDHLELANRRARDREQLEIGQRLAAEQHAQQLTALMAEQQQLTQEREHLLRVMTHEVRQPLHNASGVLQSLNLALHSGNAFTKQELSTRVGRADAVLGEVRDVLDNVLSAALLLNRTEVPAMQATEVRFLVQLCLLDLPEPQRQRVQTAWRTSLDTVLVEPSLLRLALRNLLRNAFVHGGPEVNVSLIIEERFAPHCLVLTVMDDGPGLPQAILQRMGQDAPSEPLAAPVVPSHGNGLGMQIVRRVMALHGGRLAVHNLAHKGLSAAMEIPVRSGDPA